MKRGETPISSSHYGSSHGTTTLFAALDMSNLTFRTILRASPSILGLGQSNDIVRKATVQGGRLQRFVGESCHKEVVCPANDLINDRILLILDPRTIKRHWDGVLRWFESGITNGVLEAALPVLRCWQNLPHGLTASMVFGVLAEAVFVRGIQAPLILPIWRAVEIDSFHGCPKHLTEGRSAANQSLARA